MTYLDEPEVIEARRCSSHTQAQWAASERELYLPYMVSCSWYGTAVSPERGSFCLVREGSDFDSDPARALHPDGAVGEYLRLSTAEGRSVLVYVLGSTDAIDTPLAVTRRAFMSLGLLPDGTAEVYAGVLDR